MKLYSIVNEAVDECKKDYEKAKHTPSYIKIGARPFARLYCVSKNKKVLERFVEDINENKHKGIDVDGKVHFIIQELSSKGAMKFYFQRYILGKLSFLFGESFDLDCQEKGFTYINWLTSTANR